MSSPSPRIPIVKVIISSVTHTTIHELLLHIQITKKITTPKSQKTQPHFLFAEDIDLISSISFERFYFQQTPFLYTKVSQTIGTFDGIYIKIIIIIITKGYK